MTLERNQAPGEEPCPNRLQQLLFDLVSKIPKSKEIATANPRSRSKSLARTAAMKAGAISGTLALPPGPLGLATVLPDLLAMWRVQKQMVADIAAVHGKPAFLNREMMAYCLFGHGSPFFRDFAVRVGERVLVRRVCIKALQKALLKMGLKIGHRAIGQAASRYVPVLGALAIGGYTYYDTRQIATTAITVFGSDLEVDGEPPASNP